MPTIAVSQVGKEVCAFLDMLAVSELTAAVIAGSDNGYNVLVGSVPGKILTFASYASHPAILNKKLDSTAAGRYQLLARYWAPYCKILGLHDFSPLSQDLIAIAQIKERGAYQQIQRGQIAAAIASVNHIWASLPGSPYGQRTNDLDMLLDVYRQHGGMMA